MRVSTRNVNGPARNIRTALCSATMSELTVLDSRRLPARLDVRQTAMLLGVQEDEIQILMRAKLLKPLGDPAQNGHKYFSSSEIEALGKDREWLDKASKTITRHWRSKRGSQIHQEGKQELPLCATIRRQIETTTKEADRTYPEMCKT